MIYHDHREIYFGCNTLISLHLSHYKQLTTATMFMFFTFSQQQRMTEQKSVLSPKLMVFFGSSFFNLICQRSAVSLCIDLLPYQQLFCICFLFISSVSLYRSIFWPAATRGLSEQLHLQQQPFDVIGIKNYFRWSWCVF